MPTHEESDHVLRIERLTSLAVKVFGENAKAARWLRKPKARFDGRVPVDLFTTEEGARLVEEALLQLDHGFTF